METSALKTNGSPSAVQSAGSATQNVPQETIIYCAHRGHGCISQRGYRCLHGPKCEPVDQAGRRFVVFEWLANGQRLATRHHLDDFNGKAIAPVIDAETQNAYIEGRARV